MERARPPLALFENVRGHLTLGFDVVLAELHRIGYDVRWTLLRAVGCRCAATAGRGCSSPPATARRVAGSRAG